jgi:hypothetical protein
MFGGPEHRQCGGDEPDFGTGLPEATGGPAPPYQPVRKLSNAALRRELWRDNPQQSVEDHAEIARGFLYAPPGPGAAAGIGAHHAHPYPESAPFPGDVFKFDSFDRDRFLARESRSCDEQVK